MFEFRISARATEKHTMLGKSVYFFPTTWKVMRKHVWSDIVSLQTRRLNNSTKCLLHALMTTMSFDLQYVNTKQHCHVENTARQCRILQEILRVQNLRQVERYAFSEVIRLFQSVGCVRNKLQSCTVLLNQKSFLWMRG